VLVYAVLAPSHSQLEWRWGYIPSQFATFPHRAGGPFDDWPSRPFALNLPLDGRTDGQNLYSHDCASIGSRGLKNHTLVKLTHL